MLTSTSQRHSWGFAFVSVWLFVLVLAIGLWGFRLALGIVPLASVLCWLCFRQRIAVIYPVIGVMADVLLVALFMPPFGSASPAARVVNDQLNLLGICFKLSQYRSDKGDYPGKLSHLITGGYTPLVKGSFWISPRGAGELDLRKEGPLRALFDDLGTLPPPARSIQVPWDVDDGDYLYVPPPPHDVGSGDFIILMTRPGLLYRNQVNVVFANCEAKTMDYRTWTRDNRVQQFLREWEKIPGSRSRSPLEPSEAAK